MTHNEYMRQYYQLRKEHHYCRLCGKRDVFTLNGRTLCADCAYEKAEKERSKKQNSAVERQKEADRHKAWVEKKKAEGYCIYCGNRKADKGYVSCSICRNKSRIKQAEYRAQSTANYPRGENGYCYQCNKQMAIPGHRLCQDCYDKKVVTLLENRKKIDRENHPWKALNNQPFRKVGT